MKKFILTTYSMITKTFLLSTLLLTILFVSCDKSNDPDQIEPEQEISVDSIYFSCTINNELLEFKSPTAKFFSSGKVNSRLGVLKDNRNDSSFLEVSREFCNDKYFVKFRFNDIYLVDTTATLWNLPEVKEDLFKVGDHPFQFLSLDDFGMGIPSSPYVGVHINIYDIENHKTYNSSISYVHRDDLNELNDFKENTVMHITDSYFINSNASFNDTFGTETSDNWYLEANFKCKLYSGDPFDPNYTKNALYITDGVIKGCF